MCAVLHNLVKDCTSAAITTVQLQIQDSPISNVMNAMVILPMFNVTVMMLRDMVDSVIVLNDEHCKGN